METVCYHFREMLFEFKDVTRSFLKELYQKTLGPVVGNDNIANLLPPVRYQPRAGPIEGDLRFDCVTNTCSFYNGKEWVSLTGNGGESEQLL